MEDPLLGGLTPRQFLRRHWQKTPLLVRRALPGFAGVIGRRALFALAARPYAEARLVERRGARWRVTEAPIAPARLARAGARDWTLLVNAVEHHAPAAERLLRRFAFLPQWRLDDVMVSYAAPGGGVGPHWDAYDVFLVQARGRRLWRLARPRAFRTVEGAPLRLIADFRAEEEYLLEPGDLLYLPPGWGHDGIALEPCMTCSVGMRAPQGEELAAAFLDHLHERGLPAADYRDPDRAPAARPAHIDRRLLEHAARLLAAIRWRRADVAEFLGRYLSAPRASAVFAPRRARPRVPLERCDAVLDARSRMLYRGAQVFLNGESYRVARRQRAPLARLADRRRAPGRLLARAGLAPLVYDWYGAGWLHLAPAAARR
ncbi:MAG: cupin domain-containing protein [Burkholderiales bacterium]|nr:cupin domain-containing protein [Burkholderiales bacterium]